MFKRGMSTIIVTIIMITLVLAAVGVVWVIVQNILEEGADDISLGALKINLDIEKVKITDTGVEVKIKRNAGKADLIGINFIISDGVDTQVFEEVTTMGELATKTFTLSYTGFVKSVEIAPVLRSESGKEKIVNVVEKFDKNSIGLDDLNDYEIISWWRFGGNANDEIGNNDGTVFGATITSEGKFGQAYSFDGITNYISISDNSNFNFKDNDFTVSSWVKVNDQRSYVIIGTITGGDNNGFSLLTRYNSENPSFWVQESSTSKRTEVFSNNQILPNEWYNIVGVRDGENHNIYINGMLKKTIKKVPSILSDNQQIVIGRMRSGQHEMNGFLDELMIFNKALTESQVKSLYELDLS